MMPGTSLVPMKVARRVIAGVISRELGFCERVPGFGKWVLGSSCCVGFGKVFFFKLGKKGLLGCGWILWCRWGIDKCVHSTKNFRKEFRRTLEVSYMRRLAHLGSYLLTDLHILSDNLNHTFLKVSGTDVSCSEWWKNFINVCVPLWNMRRYICDQDILVKDCKVQIFLWIIFFIRISIDDHKEKNVKVLQEANFWLIDVKYKIIWSNATEDLGN